MAVTKKSAKASEEVRRSKRVTKVLPIDCKIIEFADNRLAKHVLNEGDSFGGRTINISKDGLLINSDYELDKKTRVEIVLSLKEDDKTKIHLTGEIAWAKRNAYDIHGRWAMGISILEAKPADIFALADFFKDEA
jgi:hypothetical protein